jgi:hypothetical protein
MDTSGTDTRGPRLIDTSGSRTPLFETPGGLTLLFDTPGSRTPLLDTAGGETRTSGMFGTCGGRGAAAAGALAQIAASVTAASSDVCLAATVTLPRRSGRAPAVRR